MKSSNKRVLFLINTITSYQNNFYFELSKLINIKVIVLNRKHKNYNFKLIQDFYEYLDNQNNKKNKLKKIIDYFNPTHIIFGGYRLDNSFFIKKLISKKKVKTYYWLERLNQKKNLKLSILKILLRKILKNADGIIAIGTEAKNFYKDFNTNVINIPYSIKVEKTSKKKKRS